MERFHLLSDSVQTKNQASVLRIFYKVSTCLVIVSKPRIRLLSLGFFIYIYIKCYLVILNK